MRLHFRCDTRPYVPAPRAARTRGQEKDGDSINGNNMRQEGGGGGAPSAKTIEIIPHRGSIRTRFSANTRDIESKHGSILEYFEVRGVITMIMA